MVRAALANAAWVAAAIPSRLAFAAALDDPGRAQEQVLRRHLADNADTAFGRAHGFADIRSPHLFAARVPPRDYDDFAPWVDRVRVGGQNVLTREAVRRLVPTGGSTAARKLIPYTAAMQRELNRAINPWVADLYARRPRALLGPAYWSVTPAAGDAAAAEGDRAPDPRAGVAIGFDDDAEYLGGWRKHLVDAAMAVPGRLRDVADAAAWRYATLLLLLRRRDLALISVWHPSFLDLLLGGMRDEWPRLLDDVATGGCAVDDRLPPGLRATLCARPDPGRARALRRAGPGAPARLWPMLRVVSCWADGHAAPAAAALAAALPGVAVQPKGLLATEGVVSIPFAGRHPLAVRSHFLEFEDDAGRVALAPDLRAGRTYRVLLTTGGGLYRYRLHDEIRVDGVVGRTPSIRFVGKAGLISDRAGEKLTDGFVAAVIERLYEARPPRPAFALLAPETDAGGCRYALYAGGPEGPRRAAAGGDRPAADSDRPGDDHGLSAALDALLGDNPQYAYCRRLGQLRPARVVRVGGDAYARYVGRLVAAGQRLGDVKPAALSPLDDWASHFDAPRP